MVYFDNLNVTLKYFSDNMNNVNSTILRINNRLTNIEDNIELILYNTNQENMVSSPSGEINFIN